MSYLFDYGEFLIRIGPVFLIIMAVAAALLWNSLPSRASTKRHDEEDKIDS